MASTLVGLDIGSSGIRAAEFKLSSRGPSLRKFASVPLPAGAVRSGVVADADAVTAALRTLWSQGKFSTKSVALGLANEGVLVRQMDLDWMPPADFRKALRYQVADALPVPVDEANLDYHLLDDLELPGEADGDPRRVARILLVAASREIVDGFVKAAQAAGLRVVRADLLPFALIRGTGAGSADSQTEAIIDIGADTVSVVVHQGGQPRYVRIIPGIGGDHITRALQDHYDWSYEDAERTKIVVGLPPAATGPGSPELEHPAQEVIAEKVAGLVTEIRATLNYFLASDSAEEHALSRVLLAGSGARLARLPELMTDELGVPVEVLDVRSYIRTSRRLALDADQDSSLVVAAGLCMSGAE